MNQPLVAPPEARFDFSADFQFFLLAAMLQDQDTLARWKQVVRPVYFTDPNSRYFLQWAYDYYDQFNVAPTETAFQQHIREWCADNGTTEYEHTYLQWLSNLLHTPVREREFLFDRVERFCRYQEYVQATARAAHRLTQHRDDPDSADIDEIPDFFAQASSRLAQTHGSIGIDPTEMPDDVLLDTLFRTDVRDPIATSWPHLNEALAGGPGRKEMMVLAAAPNVGKTWTLINIGVAAAQRGLFVVHYTLEMSEELTTHRYYATLTGINHHEIRLSPDAVIQANRRLRESGGRFIVKEFPPRSARVTDLRDHLLAVEAQTGRRVDMVIVDYADLCAAKGGSRSEADQVHRHVLSHIYTDLRAIAVSKSIAVITATQTNRGAVNKDVITIGDLAECFDKAAHADIIVGLCQTQDEVRMNRIRFHVAKNRNQRKGDEIPVSIDFACGRMTEVMQGGLPDGMPGQGAGAAAVNQFLQQHHQALLIPGVGSGSEQPPAPQATASVPQMPPPPVWGNGGAQ